MDSMKDKLGAAIQKLFEARTPEAALERERGETAAKLKTDDEKERFREILEASEDVRARIAQERVRTEGHPLCDQLERIEVEIERRRLRILRQQVELADRNESLDQPRYPSPSRRR